MEILIPQSHSTRISRRTGRTSRIPWTHGTHWTPRTP